jgi:hypothetical protein
MNKLELIILEAVMPLIGLSVIFYKTLFTDSSRKD